MTAELDLSAYLASHQVQTYRAAGQEVTAHCWFCPDGDPKGKGKLYLNTESWLWSCKRCGEAGNRKTLLEHFGDIDEAVSGEVFDPAARRRILLEATNLAHEMLLGNEKMLDYLLVERGLAAEVIAERKFGYVPRNIGLSDMLPSREQWSYRDLIATGLVTVSGREVFNDSFTIPYWSHGAVVQLRARHRSGDIKYQTLGGDSVRLYNADALFGADEVLVTEAEWDCDAVLSALLHTTDRRLQNLAVVGLPGAGSWPEGLIDMLSECKRVFIGLDPDEVGATYAAKLKEAVGNRARVVHLPPDLPKCDWGVYLLPKTGSNPHGGHGWAEVRDLLSEADLAGKRLYTPLDAATKWRRRQTETPGIKLGWGSLDAVIRPGLKPGQVMIPLARTGSGKSVYLSNLAHNLRRQRPLYISLELTAAEIYEHLYRIHRFHSPEADFDELLDDYRYLRVVDQNRLGRGDLGDLIREYIEDVGERPGVVLLDYLQYYARGFRGTDQLTRVSDAIMEIKAVAKEEGVSAIVPSQANRSAEAGKPLDLTSAKESGTIEETGDFVVSLFRPEQMVVKDGEPLPPSGNFNMQLLKSRHGGAGQTFNLRMSLMSLAIVDPLFDRKGSVRVESENSLVRQGVHYMDYRRQLDEAIAQRALELP